MGGKMRRRADARVKCTWCGGTGKITTHTMEGLANDSVVRDCNGCCGTGFRQPRPKPPVHDLRAVSFDELWRNMPPSVWGLRDQFLRFYNAGKHAATVQITDDLNQLARQLNQNATPRPK